jgi:hypothetical protein
MLHDRGRLPRAKRPRSRLTDRAEDVASWVLMSAALLLLVVAWMSGLAFHGQLTELAATESTARTEIPAVLLEAVPAAADGQESTGVPVLAAARWIGVDGSPRTGRVSVTSDGQAGSAVSVWIDRDGTITTPPSTGADALIGGLLVGFNVLLLGAAVLIGIWAALRRLTASVNAARWEREWAQVGPEWSGHVQ